MDLHQDARLTFRSREALAKKLMIERLTVNAAAVAFIVSRKTAAKWVGRYRALGLSGLRDRSSRPLHSPHRTSSELTQMIALRRQLRPAYQIAQATGLSAAELMVPRLHRSSPACIIALGSAAPSQFIPWSVIH
jgi:transposase